MKLKCLMVLLLVLILSNILNAKDGVIDIPWGEVEKGNIVQLDGIWEFYNEEFIDSFQNLPKKDNLYFVKVPSEIKDLKKGKPFKYGTYRILLNEIPKDTFLGLRIYSMLSSYKLFINGRFYGGQGVVGESHEKEKTEFYFQNYFFTAKANEKVEIVIQISSQNFRKTGIIDSIKLSTAKTIEDRTLFEISIEMLVIGSLLIMGFYHLGLVALFRKEKTALFFGVYCIFIALRVVAQGNVGRLYFILGFGEPLRLIIEYLTFYLGVPFFVLFVSNLFKEFSNIILNRIFMGLGIIFSVTALIFPLRVSNHFIPFYQIIGIFMIIYIFKMIISAFIAKKDSSRLALFGAVILFIGYLNDILNISGIIKTISIFHMTFLCFIFLQAIILAIRFAKTQENYEKERYKRTMVEYISETLAKSVEEIKMIDKFSYYLHNENNKEDAAFTLMVILVRKVYSGILNATFLSYSDKNNELKGEICFYKDAECNIEADINDLKQISKKWSSQKELMKREISSVLIQNNKMVEEYFKESYVEDLGVNKLVVDKEIRILDDRISDLVIIPVFYEERKYGIISLKIEDTEEKNELLRIMGVLKIYARNFAVYLENKRLEQENLKSERLTAIIQFSNAIVHEIKTPLVAIKGFANIIKNKYTTDKKLLSYMEVMDQNCERVDSMATSILEYSSSKLNQYKFEEINLKQELEKVINKMTSDIDAIGIYLVIEVDAGIYFVADKQRTEKMFEMIVKNSIEAVDLNKSAHEILIKYNGLENALTIYDNGMGISKEVIEKVFEPLVTTKIQGTGLGLTIAKDIAERHGWNIKIASIEGKWTEVKVVFRN